jgi:DNA-binding IclR family transcriptional regulator
VDTTLAKGLAVMEWLARQSRPCAVSEVAQAHGIGRSNAHRTLRTLVSCGWVEQDADTSGYRATLRLFELGAHVAAAADIANLVRPHLGRLAADTGETIHLACLDGAEIVYLDKFDSPLPVAAYSRVGGRASAACVASGKAMLAALHPDERALRDRFGALVAHTPNSIVDFEALHAELQRTAVRGWAENREEWRIGVCGLAVPIFDARRQPVAAVGMSVPSIRFGRKQAKSLIEPLRDCARAASEALGFRADASPIARFIDRPSG